jgi:hypothetical protein
MRTTLTIDDGLLRALKDIANKTDTPFKEVVDRTLRAGLEQRKRPRRARRFAARTFAMGVPSASVDLDKARRLADELEAEEVVRKVDLRK